MERLVRAGDRETMPIDSWTKPEDAPALAAHATAMIDAALVGTALAREAYWAAVRKGYNTPYNDPPRDRAAPLPPNAVATPAAVAEAPLLPVALMASMAAEIRAV